MKKLKIASFINLLVPFVIITICYVSTQLLTFNWGLTILALLALIFSMPLCGLVALVLDSIVVKKEGLGFVSFNLLVFSLIEFGFGMFCLFQIFFVRYY